MFRHRAEASVPRKAIAHWSLLAANAGFINAVAFVLVGIFVTHVTGFATLFGDHVARLEWHDALVALFVPGAFLLGAFSGGLLVDVRHKHRKVAHYDWAMGIAGLAVLVPPLYNALGGVAGADPAAAWQLVEKALFLALLCLSSGIQNAALSEATKYSVRVTHLTGLTTDLGLGLAHLFQHKTGAWRQDAELKLSWMRLAILAAFIGGTTLGAVCALRIGLASLWVPSAVCFYAAVRGHQEKFMKVVQG